MNTNTNNSNLVKNQQGTTKTQGYICTRETKLATGENHRQPWKQTGTQSVT